MHVYSEIIALAMDKEKPATLTTEREPIVPSTS